MLARVARRRVRCFCIYRRGRLALRVEDRPGTLHSTAAPGPEGPPAHPFIHAQAYDALSEDELGRLLHHSSSFDEYVGALVAAGYDVLSCDGPPALEVGAGFRVSDGRGLLGAVWPHPGQSTCLSWQPAEGELTYPHATVTVYRQDAAEMLLEQLARTTTFEQLARSLASLGVRLTPQEG